MPDKEKLSEMVEKPFDHMIHEVSTNYQDMTIDEILDICKSLKFLRRRSEETLNFIKEEIKDLFPLD